jgi:hypothetical protein
LYRYGEDVTDETPGMTMSAVTSELARRWRKVSDEERAVCEAIAAEDKAGLYKLLNSVYP